MNNELLSPVLGLGETIPDQLFVLHHPATDRYGCFCHQGIHGVACFSSEDGAARFGEWIDLGGMKIRQVSFDEARELAKQRPLPINALILLDNLQSPNVHFVR